MSSIVFRRTNRRTLIVLAVLAMALAAMTAVSFAQTPEPPTINLDVGPLFDSMNNYIPVFLLIFAIPGGIAIAIAVVKMLINAVQNAFKGASGR